MRRAHLLLPSLLAAILLACGGATETDLFGDSTTPSGAPPTENPTTETVEGNEPTGTDGGTRARDAGDAGSKKDAQVVDASSTVDSSTDATTWSKAIYCGGRGNSTPRFCKGNDTCCGSTTGTTQSFICHSGGPNNCNGVSIACDDRADCGGQLCCGAYDTNTGYKSLQCMPSCPAPTATLAYMQMCDPDAPVDECLATGKECTASVSLPGFFLCL